uniref:Uncharacterized protein n=1 Tax=Leersia perrieri TaxID=77586 RepID=A0A0D9XVY6_9ORYZ
MTRDALPEPGSVLPKSTRGGLSSHAVFRDYQSWRISPLQERPRPAHMYTNFNDSMRTHVGAPFDWSENDLAILVRRTLGVTVMELTLLPPG